VSDGRYRPMIPVRPLRLGLCGLVRCKTFSSFLSYGLVSGKSFPDLRFWILVSSLVSSLVSAWAVCLGRGEGCGGWGGEVLVFECAGPDLLFLGGPHVGQLYNSRSPSY
jgi:hypothetical protein